MAKIFWLNKLVWYARWPSKCAIFGLVLLFVCFPYPDRLVRHLSRWRDPNALIEPDNKALQPLMDELRPQIGADRSPKETLRLVEQFVYRKIPYDWDWNVWGTSDYIPTVSEVLEKGREDCDGRAVLGASMLANLGFKAELVTDFSHVWVKTEHGETMGPGKRKAIVATQDGLKIQRGALAQIPKSVAYGVAVFPLLRELILLGALWLLLMRAKGGVYCNLTALVYMVAGLILLRKGGFDYRNPILWQQLAGLGGILVGIACLLIWARANAREANRGVVNATTSKPG